MGSNTAVCSIEYDNITPALRGFTTDIRCPCMAQSNPTITTPLVHDANVFPSLPNMYQHQQSHLHNDIFDKLINLLTTKMEKIIEETTKRLFESLQQKIKKIEQTVSSVETLINDDIISSSSSFSDSDEDIEIVNNNNHRTKETKW
ncbi:unnamed protein product [Rotaria magnacalcarata]|uniref:Uncharacterized protein n=3 Tax=Rotaria magnacalcarata TaxID=392030 RepID=A0A819P507_9BILA|nr:unnamed protein product [Rotaria magnacalcarata]